jgi:hypothetical protein
MKYIASALGGFALASLLFLLVVYPQVKSNWHAQGQTDGYQKASVAMHQTAAKLFPNKTPNCTPVAILGGAKPELVEVVDCGAFKTLRVSVD